MKYIYCVEQNEKLTPYSNEYDFAEDAFNWWKDIKKGAWLRSVFDRKLELCRLSYNTKGKEIYIKL